MAAQVFGHLPHAKWISHTSMVEMGICDGQSSCDQREYCEGVCCRCLEDTDGVNVGLNYNLFAFETLPPYYQHPAHCNSEPHHNAILFKTRPHHYSHGFL